MCHSEYPDVLTTWCSTEVWQQFHFMQVQVHIWCTAAVILSCVCLVVCVWTSSVSFNSCVFNDQQTVVIYKTWKWKHFWFGESHSVERPLANYMTLWWIMLDCYLQKISPDITLCQKADKDRCAYLLQAQYTVRWQQLACFCSADFLHQQTSCFGLEFFTPDSILTSADEMCVQEACCKWGRLSKLLKPMWLNNIATTRRTYYLVWKIFY